jgi:hypothetical protein
MSSAKEGLIDKNIDLLKMEYSTLREELLQFHRMQHNVTVQAQIAIGAMFLVFSWPSINDALKFYTLTAVIPIYAFVTFLSCIGVIIRIRIIRSHITTIENKFESLFPKNEARSENAIEYAPISHNRDYLLIIKRYGKIIRIDTGPFAAVLFLVPFLSYFMARILFSAADIPDMPWVGITATLALLCLFVVVLFFYALLVIKDLKEIEAIEENEKRRNLCFLFCKHCKGK